jgi:hypothetical protein
MLRTCSEPDMTKLFHDEILDRDNNMNNKAQNDNQKSNEESQFKKTFNDDRNKNNEKQFGTLRLARSLEDALDDNKDDRINSEEVIVFLYYSSLYFIFIMFYSNKLKGKY